jgi:hypothetical protein
MPQSTSFKVGLEMKLRDICLDTFNYFEEDETEVVCYLYHITEAEDLFMVQGETLNELAWAHIKGMEPAMFFWESLKRGGNILERIRGD